MKIKPWREIKREPTGWIECHALVALSKDTVRFHSMSLRCQRHDPRHVMHQGQFQEPEGAIVTISWTEAL